jgi:hypothetical protein
MKMDDVGFQYKYRVNSINIFFFSVRFEKASSQGVGGIAGRGRGRLAFPKILRLSFIC